MASYEDIAHLLRRAGFGGLPAEIQALAKLDLPQAVDAVLNAAPPSVDEPAEGVANPDDRYKSGVALSKWWLNRMITTPAPIVEKMVLFWHGHFVSSLDKCDVIPMWNQNQLFREKGMGSFTELAQAVSVDPAMLHYLDNRNNRAKKRNENFARELMELFTVGVGNYKQEDVVAAARAWTGHGLSEDKYVYVYMPDKHDNTNKTFLGITKNWNGPDIVNELCTGKGKEITARHITLKMWEFFAYPDPKKALVDALASQFMSSDMNIKVLLKAILTRSEFYSQTSKQGHVRSPVEFVTAALRYSGIGMTEAHPEWYFEPMGQRLLYPPNVAGWKADKAWITTSALWAKANFASHLVWMKGHDDLLQDTEDIAPDVIAKQAVARFGIDKPSKSTLAAIAAAITNDRTNKGYNERQNIITLTMLSPEFQMG